MGSSLRRMVCALSAKQKDMLRKRSEISCLNRCRDIRGLSGVVSLHIVALQLVPQPVVFVINGLFHCEILLYNSSVDIFAHMSQAPDCHTLLYPVMGFLALAFALMSGVGVAETV